MSRSAAKKPAKRRSIQDRSLAVIIHLADEGGFWASCPSIHGCYSQGETMDEVLTNIRESIRVSIETLPKHELSAIPTDESIHLVKI